MIDYLWASHTKSKTKLFLFISIFLSENAAPWKEHVRIKQNVAWNCINAIYFYPSKCEIRFPSTNHRLSHFCLYYYRETPLSMKINKFWFINFQNPGSIEGILLDDLKKIGNSKCFIFLFHMFVLFKTWISFNKFILKKKITSFRLKYFMIDWFYNITSIAKTQASVSQVSCYLSLVSSIWAVIEILWQKLN